MARHFSLPTHDLSPYCNITGKKQGYRLNKDSGRTHNLGIRCSPSVANQNLQSSVFHHLLVCAISHKISSPPPPILRHQLIEGPVLSQNPQSRLYEFQVRSIPQSLNLFVLKRPTPGAATRFEAALIMDLAAPLAFIFDPTVW